MTLTPFEFEEQFVQLCWEWDMNADGEEMDTVKKDDGSTKADAPMTEPAKMEAAIKSKLDHILSNAEELFNDALLKHSEMSAEVRATPEWKMLGDKLGTVEAALMALKSVAAGF